MRVSITYGNTALPQKISWNAAAASGADLIIDLGGMNANEVDKKKIIIFQEVIDDPFWPKELRSEPVQGHTALQFKKSRTPDIKKLLNVVKGNNEDNLRNLLREHGFQPREKPRFKAPRGSHWPEIFDAVPSLKRAGALGADSSSGS